VQTPQLDRTYHPRAVASLGLWRIRNWSFKAYGIHHDPNQAKMFTAQRLELARIHAGAQIALAEAFPSHDSVGYLIVHQARRHVWHIQHWWTDSEILAGVTSRLDEDNQFQRCGDPYIASTWDLAIISHERNAWTKTMLMPVSDPKAYLSAWLPNGLY
jgi:hypothetical protein